MKNKYLCNRIKNNYFWYYLISDTIAVKSEKPFLSKLLCNQRKNRNNCL